MWLHVARRITQKHPMTRKREALGLSKQELAAVVGVNPSTISDIENYVTGSPGITIVVNVAKALHCNVEDVWPMRWTQLERGQVRRPPTPEEIQRLANGDLSVLLELRELKELVAPTEQSDP